MTSKQTNKQTIEIFIPQPFQANASSSGGIQTLIGNANLGVLYDFANDDDSDDGDTTMKSFDRNLVKTRTAGEHRTSCCAEKH